MSMWYPTGILRHLPRGGWRRGVGWGRWGGRRSASAALWAAAVGPSPPHSACWAPGGAAPHCPPWTHTSLQPAQETGGEEVRWVRSPFDWPSGDVDSGPSSRWTCTSVTGDLLGLLYLWRPAGSTVPLEACWVYCTPGGLLGLLHLWRPAGSTVPLEACWVYCNSGGQLGLLYLWRPAGSTVPLETQVVLLPSWGPAGSPSVGQQTQPSWPRPPAP